MRAWEFISEDNTPSKPISLRSIHFNSIERRHVKQLDKKRHAMSTMYAVDDPRDKEFDKQKLALDQREIALDGREAELDLI
jgi:hypothetical protein